MDLLKLMRAVAALLSLIQRSESHSRVTTCQPEDNKYGDPPGRSNPSPVLSLSAELSDSQSSLSVRWAVNVDSTIETLKGTWITYKNDETDEERQYRCEYQPPFTSGEIVNASGEQLWFSFTVSNVSTCPSTQHSISAYNLPRPFPPTTADIAYIEYIKTFMLDKIDWSAHVHSVLHDDKVVLTFNANFAADSHTITLREKTHVISTDEKKGGCKVEECQEELEYTGSCEDLTIEITPYFEHCWGIIDPAQHKVNCTNKSGLVIGVVCVLALLFMLLCCCIICQILRWVHIPKRGGSVRVLLVYPAVDGVFQRAVLSLAQFLQSCAGVTVVIDLWDSGSLAEQGPLRWINTQAELADRVLIIPAPQRSQTDDHKSLIPDMTDDGVSASASNLFTLTLNLVSSAAQVPHGRDKFWVVKLQHDEKSVQTELRGCRTFLLPRDEERLHQQLSGGEIQSPALMSCFSSFCSRKALEHMEVNTDFPICAKANSQDEKRHFFP